VWMKHYGYGDDLRPADGVVDRPTCDPSPYTDRFPTPLPTRPLLWCGPTSVMVEGFSWARAECNSYGSADPDDLGACVSSSCPPRGDAEAHSTCQWALPNVPDPSALPYWENMPVRIYNSRAHDHDTFDAIDRGRLRLK
jgi:hypothetical protein